MNDQERAAALTRMLADAVEPVQPAPGAQARLLARVRTPSLTGQRLRWAAAGVTTAAVVIVAVVFFAGHLANGSDGTSASTAGLPSVAGESSTSAALPAAPSASARLTTPKSASGPDAETFGSAAPSATQPDSALDLDGDGKPDTLTIEQGNLVAELSHAGVQAVRLPPVGPGAKVLSVTSLPAVSPTSSATSSGATAGRVPIAFIRLEARPGQARDTAVALDNGWLTVLTRGGTPVQLLVDSGHGYGCTEAGLALAGADSAYVVRRSQLVPSPFLVATRVPPGQVTGC